MAKKTPFFVGFLGLLFLLSCSSSGNGGIADNIFAPLGDPLPNISQEDKDRFDRGIVLMQKRFTVEDGMGPEFNVVSCAACHEKPVIGGVASRYRDFFIVGKRDSDATFTLVGKNGIQDHYTLDSESRFPSDSTGNVFAKRNPIPLFGMGLIAEIDEREIIKNADPDDRNGDGISGEANQTAAGLFGRFGMKAQNPDLEAFVRAPLLNHAGITSIDLSTSQKDRLPTFAYRFPFFNMNLRSPSISIFPVAFAQGVITGPTSDNDAKPDPELSPADLFDLVAATMLFAAPQPDEPTEETKQGEKLFKKANCTGCHIPALRSKRGLIPLYSDLLIHDMGEALADGVKMGKFAESSEFRTQPLWGVAASAPYLHDGRADTIEQAINMHGGEAKASRDFFVTLSASDRGKVIAFLESLGGKSQKTDGLLPANAPVPAVGEYGGPTVALSGDDADRFKAGRAIFDLDFGVDQGLGPKFNGDACRSCHFDPVLGGSGPMDVNVLRQGIVNGSFTSPPEGTLTHKHSTAHNARPSVNSSANLFEHRQTPHLFGLGLIGQIPEDIILSRVDPDDNSTFSVDSDGRGIAAMGGDGIKGRSRVVSGKVGRFGWKANVPSVVEFARDGMSSELGITVPSVPGLSFGALTDQDDVADPEISSNDLANLVFFMEHLGPPPRNRKNPAAEDRGFDTFKSVGCDKCHVPFMKTDEGVQVDLFSDLLLHDVAPAGFKGVEDDTAGMREFRTPPLWGLSKTAPYMHDGRANTVLQAIQAHEGTATGVISNFTALQPNEKNDLIEFLNSL